MKIRRHAFLIALTLPLMALSAAPTTAPAGPPAVGAHAPDFTLDTLDGQAVHLAALTHDGPVVVIQLRGWVGYQCPICNKQVGAFIGRSADLKRAGAQVVLVYPGPADDLKAHAADFAAGKSMPDNFHFVIDPGLAFVDAWGLRWDQAGETAYPATFAVDRACVVRFAKVSRSHGGRATPQQVIDALAKTP